MRLRESEIADALVSLYLAEGPRLSEAVAASVLRWTSLANSVWFTNAFGLLRIDVLRVICMGYGEEGEEGEMADAGSSVADRT